MKKLILLFTFVLGLTLTSQAQSKPAEFKFDKETYNFGKIPSNKPATVDFNFTNIGDTPLIITNVETTCGCTVPEYTKTPDQKRRNWHYKSYLQSYWSSIAFQQKHHYNFKCKNTN